ncbi:coil containing protein [Vibrio phage 2.275.O._10N.286.54.E11]|nr:coil containing protein [Vibrio phage 2.275.O._10N.286.54.E11]
MTRDESWKQPNGKYKCPECDKEYSAKGIMSHYISQHTDQEGFAKKAEQDKANNNSRLSAYKKDPTKCNQCLAVLSYDKRKNKYCSHSCAAKSSNASRSKVDTSGTKDCNCISCGNTIKIAKNASATRSKCVKCKKPKTAKKPKNNPVKDKNPGEHTKVKPCIICGKYHTKISGKYCNICQPNVRLYRARAEFTFNVYDYPDRFNIALIDQYGWYSPGGKKKTKNINGISRDHKYSVSEGFANKVDPKLLSHPANCEIMLQLDNVKKRHRSSITLDELKQLIEEWDKKH